jgi:TP901 family phage tail tape measure protein
MSDQIKFNDLFNAQSFDDGTKEIARYIGLITDKINEAKGAANQLTASLGKELKNEIAQLSTQSQNLAKDMADMANKMANFQQTTSNTKKVLSDYEKENEKLKKQLQQLKTAQEGNTKAAKDSTTAFTTKLKSMIGLASGAAIVYKGITILTEQFKLALKSTMEFETAMKEVQAISRASAEELKLLTANANKLGSTTEKTAGEVAKLQKELAKLGFTSAEIILSTQAIVDLSTATGEDLASSAIVAAATLRAFGLEAQEMDRVVNVMAGSFVRSGLDLEKFRESMKLVAPIARAVNVNIETTTAMLSKLADAGLSGSLAGTALRNLLSSMADPTEDLTKRLGGAITNSTDLVNAFKKLKREGIELAEAVQLVDVRARPAFFTLVAQADAVESLAIQYQYLEDEASKIAETMRDTLANDVAILESAFDSLRRNLMEQAVPSLRTVTKDLTAVIEGFRFAAASIAKYDEDIKKGGENTTAFGKALKGLMDALTFSPILDTVGDTFRYLMDSLTESNNIDRVNEQFDQTDISVGKAVDSFSNLSEALSTVKEAQQLLEQENDASIDSINKLRAENERLSKTTEDNRHFLILLKAEKQLAIKEANGYVESLKGEERQLAQTIKMLEEFRDTVGIGTEQTEQLEAAEKRLSIIRGLRITQEERLVIVNKELNEAVATGLENLEEQIALEGKLQKIRDQIIQVNAKSAEDQAKAFFDETAGIEDRSEALDFYLEKKKKVAQAGLQAELNSIKAEEISNEEKDLKRSLAYTKHKVELLKIDKEYSKLKIQLQITENDRIEQIWKDLEKVKVKTKENTTVDLSKIEKELFAEDEAKAKFELAKLDKHNKEVIDKEKEKKDKIIKITEQLAQGLSRIGTFMFDNAQIRRDNELKAIDVWEREKLDMAGDNEEAKKRIELQAERRRTEIRKKQAIANRDETMFQIALDTAASIVKTFAQYGIPKGIPFAAIAAALGAAQLAIVKSRPLPEFYKGTDDSPEGFAKVGERGRELVQDGRTKKWSLTPDKTTVAYLTKGSKVITNAETERVLAQDHNGRANQFLQSKVIVKDNNKINYKMMGQEFKSAVSTIPVNITNFDEKGVTKYVMKRSSKITRLNKRY